MELVQPDQENQAPVFCGAKRGGNKAAAPMARSKQTQPQPQQQQQRKALGLLAHHAARANILPQGKAPLRKMAPQGKVTQAQLPKGGEAVGLQARKMPSNNTSVAAAILPPIVTTSMAPVWAAPKASFSVFEDSPSMQESPLEKSLQGLEVTQDSDSTATCVQKDEEAETEEETMALDSTLEFQKVVCEEQQRQGQLRVVQVWDYAREIYLHLREVETQHRPKPHYMRKQPDITAPMRSILVDWLVEVEEEYRMQNETLHLAVSYVDRFLSVMSVWRSKLQLVGTAAMLVAAKYEEIYPPEVADFVYITDDTYTRQQLLRMEHLLLKVLSFDLAAPTALCFLNHWSLALAKEVPEEEAEKVLHLAMFLLELALVEGQGYLGVLPSVLAGGALAVANLSLGMEPWGPALEAASGYTLNQHLGDVCLMLLSTFRASAAQAQQAVRDKYKSARWHQVALLPPPEILSL